MYESYYGVRERPFDLTPNPRFLLLTGKHREALSNLQYGIASRRGLTLLIGEAGTGKTTLVRSVVGDLERRKALIAYLNNPTLTRDEFCEFLAAAFDLPASAAESKTALLAGLARVVAQRGAAGRSTALIIDEAQSLPDALLEEIRLLANIETATDKLLPVVLAGQPELAERLNQPSLRQLKQRVSLRCQLDPLDARETAEYIAGRIRVAGGNSAAVFTRQAVNVIYEHSGGIPRLISVICDNAMISGFAADQRPVGRSIVEDVCRDFDLPRCGTANVAVMPPPAADKERPAATAPNGAEREGTAPVPLARPGTAAESAEGRDLFQHFTARRRFTFF